MTDRDKVIMGLDICINSIMRDCPPCPLGCPYYEQCTTKNEDGMTPVFLPLLKDALELMKEHIEDRQLIIQCKDCKYWTPLDGDPNNPYGWCDTNIGGLWHRCEQCDHFERKDGEVE